jgi:hypothetical protein
MTDNSNATGSSERKLPWFGITRILLVTILIAVIYLLAEDMVGHRFFRGGWINHHDRLMP